MLTCVANFTTYICFSMFTEEGATNMIINTEKKFKKEKMLKITQFCNF